MGNVTVNVELKYHIVRKDGNKEISQRHIKETVCTDMDEDDFNILRLLTYWFFTDPEILLGDGD
jgi:hypothetical protein